MSNLEEFLNNKLPEDKDDLFMEKITKLRMDGIKKDYEQKLQKSHGVSKEIYKAKKIRRTTFIVLCAAMIIALVYLLTATDLLIDHQDNRSNIIASYIQNNKIQNNDIVRGEASDEAYNQYQLGNYEEAINNWESGDMNLQDSFYLAMSILHAGDYEKAENNFNVLSNKIVSGEKFYPELQLYWALTLILLDKKESATMLYEAWPEDSWMAREYRKAL